MAATALSAIRPTLRLLAIRQVARRVAPVTGACFHQTARLNMIFKSALSDVTLVEKTIPEHVIGLEDGVESRFGDRVALRADSEVMTYNQIKRHVRSFAQSLQADHNIEKGAVVAVSLPNCPEFVVALHGALAAGGVVTPVNPACTAWELAYQLRDSGATMLVTGADSLPSAMEANKLTGSQLKKVVVVGDTPDATHVPFSSMTTSDGSQWRPVPCDVHRDMALLPYSSGTTGQPKGVVLTHFNLVSNIVQASHPELYELNPRNQLLGILPFYHAYGLTLMVNCALAFGCSVRCMKKFDPLEFLTHIQNDKLDMLHVVPPMALFLAKHPLVDKFDLSSVVDITSGAAPLSKEVTMLLRKRLPSIKLIRQGYGMTEMSPVSHADLNDPSKVVPGSAGVLLPNTSCVVADIATGEKLGPNQRGEICCKGPQMMLRYHNNPKATSQTIDRDGWLHTGDIGYMDETGHLFIEDRLKELIKVKGHQVAPAELEGILLNHPMVSDACVVQKPDGLAGERPKAFVVMKPGSKIEEKDLMAWANTHLSKYKHLVEIEFIPAIPKSAAGKILRRVLRMQEQQRTTQEEVP